MREGVHVLIAIVAIQTHMNPMLKLAKLLESKGVYVTIATTEPAREPMLSKHKTDPSIKKYTNTNGILLSPKIQVEFYSDGLSLDFDRDNDVPTFFKSLKTIGCQNLSNLVSNINKTHKISCLIFYPFMSWISHIASDNNIPCAVIWIQACSLYSIYYRFCNNSNPIPNLEQNPNDQFLELPCLPWLEVRDLPAFLNSSTPQYDSLCELMVHNLDKVNWVLGNSIYEVEKDIVDSMASLSPILTIGPLVSPFLLGKEETNNTTLNLDMWNPEDSCMNWLDKQKPNTVVYISFGSILILSQEQIDGIAIALKNIKRPFLWALKQPEEGCDQTGGKIPNWFLEETKEFGLVVKWCPQQKVLMHQALSCFLTHGGWNSTLETLVAGVPVIVYPKLNWTDHPINAKLLVDAFKVGVKVTSSENGVASSEEIERCIEKIIDGPEADEIKKRAYEWKLVARKSMSKDGSSNKNIDRFISEIGGNVA